MAIQFGEEIFDSESHGDPYTPAKAYFDDVLNSKYAHSPTNRGKKTTVATKFLVKAKQNS